MMMPLKKRWSVVKAVRTDSKDEIDNSSPEVCIKLLQVPSIKNYSCLKRRIVKSDEKWIQQFVELNGLGVLVSAAEGICDRKVKVADASLLLEVVDCIKSVLNSKGLDIVDISEETTRKLARVLDTKNVRVKKQIFEIFTGLSVGSHKGYKLAIDALEDYKKAKNQRYRFSVIVKELKNSETLPYKTTLLGFINAILDSTEDFQIRMRIRNEFIGLQLLEILEDLRRDEERTEDQDLFTQLDRFFEHKVTDDGDLQAMFPDYGIDLNSPVDVFHAIFKKIEDSPHAASLLSILHALLQLNSEDPLYDKTWQLLEKLVIQGISLDQSQDIVTLLNEGLKSLIALKRFAEAGGNDKEIDLAKEEPMNCFSTRTQTKAQIKPTVLATNEVVAACPPLSQPPPPPPPPPPKGFTAVPPPPPPPPIGAELPPQREITISRPKPLKKLPTLNWSTIPERRVMSPQRDTDEVKNIWHIVNGMKVDMTSEFEVLENLFHTSPKEKKKKKPKEKLSKVTLLDGKRSFKVNIFLRQFRKSNEEVIALLKKGDPAEVGGIEILIGLSKVLPTQEEIDLVTAYEGEEAMLGDAERFYLLLSRLSNFQLRINGMVLKEEYESKIDFLKSAIKTLQGCCKGILESNRLQQFLALVLTTGNYMNSGSFVGNAAGFRISSLLKLQDTRANKPRMTLMHYIVQVAEEKDEKLLSFPDEIHNLQKASKLSVDYLKSEISPLKENVVTMKKQLEIAEEDVKEQFELFLETATEDIDELMEDLEEINNLRVKLALYFCEDPNQFKLEELLNVLQTFAERIKQCQEQNKNRKIQKAKAQAQPKKSGLNEALPISGSKVNKETTRPTSGRKSSFANLLTDIGKRLPKRKSHVHTFAGISEDSERCANVDPCKKSLPDQSENKDKSPTKQTTYALTGSDEKRAVEAWKYTGDRNVERGVTSESATHGKQVVPPDNPDELYGGDKSKVYVNDSRDDKVDAKGKERDSVYALLRTNECEVLHAPQRVEDGDIVEHGIIVRRRRVGLSAGGNLCKSIESGNLQVTGDHSFVMEEIREGATDGDNESNLGDSSKDASQIKLEAGHIGERWTNEKYVGAENEFKSETGDKISSDAENSVGMMDLESVIKKPFARRVKLAATNLNRIPIDVKNENIIWDQVCFTETEQQTRSKFEAVPESEEMQETRSSFRDGRVQDEACTTGTTASTETDDAGSSVVKKKKFRALRSFLYGIKKEFSTSKLDGTVERFNSYGTLDVSDSSTASRKASNRSRRSKSLTFGQTSNSKYKLLTVRA